MSVITKEEILAHLNKELLRAETDATIEEYILGALKDLSLKNEFIWTETQVDTIVGTPYTSLPADYVSLLTVSIGTEPPLEKMTWREYKVLSAGQTSDNYNLPRHFCVHGGYWYAYPTCDAVYTATLFYNSFVPESEVIDGATVKSVDNIGYYFSEIFRAAIYAKTKALYCLGTNWDDKAALYETVYTKIELPILEKLVEHKPHAVKNNDL